MQLTIAKDFEVNENYLRKLDSDKPTNIKVPNALLAEMDEMWSFYHDKISAENLVTSKRNTQQIERNNLTLRTVRYSMMVFSERLLITMKYDKYSSNSEKLL